MAIVPPIRPDAEVPAFTAGQASLVSGGAAMHEPRRLYPALFS